MRSLILAFLSIALLGCATPCGGGGPGYVTMRWPFEVGQEPATQPGARVMVGPPQVYEMRVVDSGARCVPEGGRVGPYRVVAAPGQ